MSLAMNHQEPDRVPVMCQLALGHYFLHCDAAPSDIWFDSEVFAKALVELQRRYRFDGILINLPGRPPDWKSRIESQGRMEWERLRKSGSGRRVPAGRQPADFLRTAARLPGPTTTSVDLRPCHTDCRDMSGILAHTSFGTSPGRSICPILPPIRRFASALEPSTRSGCLGARGVFSPFTHLMELFGYEQA
jgi:hypothetical protein